MELSAIKERIKIRLKRTAEDIIEIGLDLIEAKRIAGHGGFEKWLKAEFEMSQDSAQRFMNVAKSFGGEIPHSAVFALNANVLYALSAPSTPENVRTEIIERVENGESINLAEIQRLKKEAADLLVEKQAIQDNLIDAKQAIEEKEKRVNWLELDKQATTKQNDELRNTLAFEVDKRATEKLELERAKLILENQDAIAQSKRIAENAVAEIERLKKERDNQIKLGVSSELQKYDSEIAQKTRQIEYQKQELEKMQKIKHELDVEVGALAVHKKAIEKIKDNLSFLAVSFDDAFETETIPAETISDWTAIYDALNKLVTQMREWRENNTLIGELVN
jgi:vacuolar-type H+-ATPase subunit I/STV1